MIIAVVLQEYRKSTECAVSCRIQFSDNFSLLNQKLPDPYECKILGDGWNCKTQWLDEADSFLPPTQANIYDSKTLNAAGVLKNKK